MSAEIPIRILECFDEAYAKLAQELGVLAPERERLIAAVRAASVMAFDMEGYEGRAVRALEGPQYVSSALGEQAFRVFFNEYSRKIYVDLNQEALNVHRLLYTEAELVCEIIRCIHFMDHAHDEEPAVIPIEEEA